MRLVERASRHSSAAVAGQHPPSVGRVRTPAQSGREPAPPPRGGFRPGGLKIRHPDKRPTVRIDSRARPERHIDQGTDRTVAEQHLECPGHGHGAARRIALSRHGADHERAQPHRADRGPEPGAAQHRPTRRRIGVASAAVKDRLHQPGQLLPGHASPSRWGHGACRLDGGGEAPGAHARCNDDSPLACCRAARRARVVTGRAPPVTAQRSPPPSAHPIRRRSAPARPKPGSRENRPTERPAFSRSTPSRPERCQLPSPNDLAGPCS